MHAKKFQWDADFDVRDHGCFARCGPAGVGYIVSDQEFQFMRREARVYGGMSWLYACERRCADDLWQSCERRV